MATESTRKRGIQAALWLTTILACASPAAGEEPVPLSRPTHNLFGMTGLIDTPTADVQPDGQVSLTGGYLDGDVRVTLSAQVLPALEAAFRYSRIGNFTFDGGETFDRSFDVKLQFIQENERWPAVALGLQDFLGTGIYSAEYIVATKGFDTGGFGHVRLSGGIGWGRFASGGGFYNPLRGLGDGFATRERDRGQGGTVNFGNYFRGEDAGLFGGIEWQTPIDGLSVKVEYNNDEYTRERRNGGFAPDIPLNVGLDYRLSEGIEVGAYYLYGSEIGVRLSLSGNPYRPLLDYNTTQGPMPLLPREPLPNGARVAGLGDVRVRVDDAAPAGEFTDPRLEAVTVHTRLGSVRWADAVLRSDPRVCPEGLARAIDARYGVIDVVTFKHEGRAVCTVALRPAGEQAVRLTRVQATEYPTDWFDNEALRQQIVEKIVAELDADGIGLFGIEIAPQRVQIYIENQKYYAFAQAIGRTARALTRHLPPSVETFEITPVVNSLAVSTIILARSELEDQVNRPDAARRTWVTSEVREADPVPWSRIGEAPGAIDYPRYSYSILPATPLNIFDPDNPVRVDVSVIGAATVEVLPGLSANAAVSKRLFGQLDDISRQSDSVLPRVRSDVARYLREGDPALLRLTGDYVTKLDHDFYGRVSIGYLERMFGGISTELLWKPARQDWGLGLELNYVKQRDYDTLFGFRDYDVITGHASAYWNTGFYGIFAQVDAGRYLAGDWGATFTLKRRFENGWEFGAFATFTDVPFDEFGEGSFDKGLLLTIPFNWLVPFETRGTYSTVLRPLARDGGQRLDIANRLWSTVESVDEPHLRANWEDFWE